MITAPRLVVLRLVLAAVLVAAMGCGSGGSSGKTPALEPSSEPTPAPTVAPAPTPTSLAAGALDPGFGDGGIVRHALAGLETADQLLLLSDGRVLVAAVVDGGLVLARFLADGRADPSFGDGGRLRTYVGPGAGFSVTRMVSTRDGGLLFAANVAGQPALLRASGDGLLDTRFGDGGVVIDEGPDAPLPIGLAEGTSGRIVTAGVRSDVATLARHLPDGARDTSFGENGLVRIAPYIGDARCHLEAVIVQPDEHVVAGGTCTFLPPSEPLLVRLPPDGRGEPERLLPRHTLPAIRGVHELVALEDGRFFLSMFDQPAIASFTVEGVGRSDFGTEGLSPYLPGASLSPLAIDASGRPVAAGYFVADPFDVRLDLAVGRFTAGGVPDASFGDAGLVVTSFGEDGVAREVTVQDDGRIVVLATVGDEAMLLRYSGGAPPE